MMYDLLGDDQLLVAQVHVLRLLLVLDGHKGPYLNDVSKIFGIFDPLPPLVRNHLLFLYPLPPLGHHI